MRSNWSWFMAGGKFMRNVMYRENVHSSMLEERCKERARTKKATNKEKIEVSFQRKAMTNKVCERESSMKKSYNEQLDTIKYEIDGTKMRSE